MGIFDVTVPEILEDWEKVTHKKQRRKSIIFRKRLRELLQTIPEHITNPRISTLSSQLTAVLLKAATNLALGNYEEALALVKDKGFLSHENNVYYQGYRSLLQGMATERTGNILAAQELTTRAKSLFSDQGEYAGLVSARIYSLVLNEKNNRPMKVFTDIENDISEMPISSQNKTFLLGFFHLNQAVALEKQGLLQPSLELYNKIANENAFADHLVSARTYNNRAIVLEKLGNTEEAIQSVEEALRIDNLIEYHEGKIKDQLMLASLYLANACKKHDICECEHARFLSNKALQLCEKKGSNKTLLATALMISAAAEMQIQPSKQISAMLKSACCVAKNIPGWEWKLELLSLEWHMRSAINYFIQGSFNEAKVAFEYVLHNDYVKKSSSLRSFFQGLTYLSEASLCFATENKKSSRKSLDKAQDKFEEAKKKCKQEGGHIEVLDFWCSVLTIRQHEFYALEMERLHKWAAASDHWIKASKSVDDLSRTSWGTQPNWGEWRTYFCARKQQMEAKLALQRCDIVHAKDALSVAEYAIKAILPDKSEQLKKDLLKDQLRLLLESIRKELTSVGKATSSHEEELEKVIFGVSSIPNTDRLWESARTFVLQRQIISDLDLYIQEGDSSEASQKKLIAKLNTIYDFGLLLECKLTLTDGTTSIKTLWVDKEKTATLDLTSRSAQDSPIFISVQAVTQAGKLCVFESQLDNVLKPSSGKDLTTALDKWHGRLGIIATYTGLIIGMSILGPISLVGIIPFLLVILGITIYLILRHFKKHSKLEQKHESIDLD